MALADEFRPILGLAELVGVLHKGGEESAVEFGLRGLARHHLDASGRGIGLHNSEGLGKHTLVDEDFAHTVLHGLTRTAVVEHDHGFAGGGGLVEQTGIAEGHAGHAGYHGLIVHQGLEAALADFGLVGGITGVPAGVLEHVAHDDSGSDSAIIAHADIGAPKLVAAGNIAHAVEEGLFADAAFEGHRLGETDGAGHSLVDQFVHRFHSDGVEHLLHLGLFRHAVVTRCEIIFTHWYCCFFVIFSWHRKSAPLSRHRWC